MHSKKALAVFLSKLLPFATPDARLEQYPTDSDVAASLLWHAHLRGDLDGKDVLDFGCGTGILGIGALALGARHVTFVDVDPRVFPTLRENLARLETGAYTIVETNAITHEGTADTVLQNPPFGTRAPGADIAFLERAMRLAPVTYSIHKTSTIAYITRVVERNGKRIAWQEQHTFRLKQTMRHHEKRIQRIETTIVRVV